MRKLYLTVSLIIIMTLLGACATIPNPSSVAVSTKDISSSDTGSKNLSGSIHDEDADIRYVAPLSYWIGNTSWSSAEKIEPDALVIFYFSDIYDGSKESSYPKDKVFLNPLIPAEELEQGVQEYFAFEIPPEYIRQSEYYNKEEHAYWTGGIGTNVDSKVLIAYNEDDVRIIDYASIICDSQGLTIMWTGQVKVRLLPDGKYKYISHDRSEPYSPPEPN